MFSTIWVDMCPQAAAQFSCSSYEFHEIEPGSNQLCLFFLPKCYLTAISLFLRSFTRYARGIYLIECTATCVHCVVCCFRFLLKKKERPSYWKCECKRTLFRSLGGSIDFNYFYNLRLMRGECHMKQELQNWNRKYVIKFSTPLYRWLTKIIQWFV